MNATTQTLRLLATGQVRRVWREVHLRCHKAWWSFLWQFIRPWRNFFRHDGEAIAFVSTDHPVAVNSPDHIAPKGTSYDNNTNRFFVLHMDRLIRGRFRHQQPAVLDLGCAGGQMVADFRALGWAAVGLEGSDYSEKHERANWPRLGGSSLFTCDIAKPFHVELNHRPGQFHLITAWEVLEHIAEADLPQVFDNVMAHLRPGGYFIATTSCTTEPHRGLELHQTRWSYLLWVWMMPKLAQELRRAYLNLKPHQYVRQNFERPSFLVYRRE